MQVSPLELFFGVTTVFGVCFSLFEHGKLKKAQNQALAIYSQLWDIVVEIDESRLTKPKEFKQLVNHVRITAIALNRSLGSNESVIIPWEFGTDQRRQNRRRDMTWEHEKIILQVELEEAKSRKQEIETRIAKGDSKS